MEIPRNIARCMAMLREAGFQAYAVGGCVRDSLLGLTPHDYDLCTNARPEETQGVFAGHPLVLAGVKHGTVSVVMEHELVEITTFRSEGTYQDGRHPDWVDFVTDLKDDLSRRDFTMNAMAWSPETGYVDPFGGQQDMAAGILRAVGHADTRFQEDSLRILRGIRFAARFRLHIEPETEQAMLRQAPLLDRLAKERVFSELCCFLPKANAGDLLRYAPILTRVIPELAPMVGFDQHSPHHAYDIYTHTAHVLESVPEEPVLRWAALLHDVGKPAVFTQDADGRGHFYGHAQTGAQLAEGILRGLKASNELREEVVWLIDHHMTRLTADQKLLRRYLSRYGYDRLCRLWALQYADMGSKGTGVEQAEPFPRIRQMIEELAAQEGAMTLKQLAVDGNDLMALGLAGKAIGQCLNRLLELVLNEELENEKAALLAEAGKML